MDGVPGGPAGRTPVSGFRAASFVAGLLCSLVGALVLVGWWFRISILMRVAPQWPAMKPSTASAFVVVGASLWLLWPQHLGRGRRLATQVVAAGVLALGLVSFLRYPIDGAPVPPRGVLMAASTAGCFILLSVSLLLRTRGFERTADALAVGPALVAITALIGYLYGERSLYSIGWYTPMAIHTATTMLIASIGSLLLHPDRGFSAAVASDTAGGLMARRLLPVAILVPVAIGWLRLQGQRAGLYDTVFGLSITVVSTILTLTVVISWNARSLHLADRRRQLAEAALRQAHDELKYRVDERTRELAIANEALLEDIAARRRAESDLRASEERYRMLVHDAPDVIYAVAPDGTLTSLNPAFERITGWKAEDWLGRSIAALIHPGDGELVNERVRAILAGLPPPRQEIRIRCASGAYVLMELSARSEIVDGALVGMRGIGRDVSERKRVEEALQSSEARFRILSESAFEGILIRDADRILDTNLALAAMLGFERDELIGMDWHALVAPGGVRRIDAYADQGDASPIEIEARRKDGSTITVRARGMAVPYQGRAARVVALQDISDLKEAERELRWALALERQASDQLRELDAMKDTFVRAVSHDLRTPLAAIIWMAQALSKGDPDLRRPEAQAFLERIESNAMRLDGLVVDLLALDRLNRTEVEVAQASVDVGALVARVVERTETLVGRPVHVEAPSCPAVVDVVMVERMVENLLVNAAKHTPDGAGVWVRVGEDAEGVVIAVEDAGPGVPPELRQAVFEPFRRGEDVRPGASGLGIGLSVVARFAELHGGRAWVEDRHGGGASFRVLLPALRAEPALTSPT